MGIYNHKKIEEKWQKHWKETNINKTTEDTSKPKCYVLDMFPYPSGDGLHVGHPKGYIATDVYSRYKRMTGHNILHPMGWDAFGLPAEQYAIKNKVHPSIAVEKNTLRFKEQLAKIGFNYDWEREINTTDPAFYKWTQWIFLKMFEGGLAYESYEPINWCPACETGLANEDLEGGACERCGTTVIKKPMRQWVLRITDYAERMLTDLDTLKWPESIKESQRNWIGKSEGAEINFVINGSEKKITVFTTRPDTLFGATYVVLAPEHKLVSELRDSILNWDAVVAYQKEAEEKTEIDRTREDKEKTGVLLEGITVIHPLTKAELPVYLGDYVLGHVGVGAIMAVPAHDSRDFAFAKKFDLPIHHVVCPHYPDLDCGTIDEAYAGVGYLINSGKFTGIAGEEAKKLITEEAGGKLVTRYRLKDWVFSRQRYWGEPIPLVHCESCGVVPVPEKDLPVTLPQVESYAPTGTGESPLADITEWVNTTCPACAGPAKRETNTMPQWAGSSWYYLRYIDPHNEEALVDKKKDEYWSPVDMYVGGAEHATRHLIYARFWHKFLYDIGVVNHLEPFERLQHVGLIMASDGRKMSKRYGNVVNPDDVVERFGADSLRVYEMFMGPFDQSIAWSTDNMMGARRFIERVWDIVTTWKLHSKESKAPVVVNESLQAMLHQTIKKVGEDIESFSFNTAISQLMILLNAIKKAESENATVFTKEDLKSFLKLLAPFAPHATEELWHEIGGVGSVHESTWPVFDPEKTVTDTVTIAIQVNGKVRDTMSISRKDTEAVVSEAALTRPTIIKWLEGKTPVKMIYVQGKILNILV